MCHCGMFDVGWMFDGWMFDDGWTGFAARKTSAYVSIRQHTGFAARETLKIEDSRAQQHLYVL